jgi:DnaA family protein
MAKQLLLNIKLNDQSHFENFYFKKNALVIHTLKNFFHASENFIYLWGKTGVGKTHLLQACCHTYQRKNRPIIYLPLKNYHMFSPDILKGLDQVDLVCLDDVDMVSEQPMWAESLFHCYNTLQQHGKKFIISATTPPKHLICALEDLKSRYMQGLILSLHELSDTEKFEAIKIRIKNRGLIMGDDAITFLIHHHTRNLKSLLHILDQLEEASLRQQRRLTIPFIKNWLGENG